VVQRFLVSPALAAIALEQAGYVDEATKQAWMAVTTPQLALRYGWSDQYHALQADADQRRAPQRLLTRAIRGYAEGVLSAQAIATLRGTTAQSTEGELRNVGIVPEGHEATWAEPADLPDVEVDLAALDDDLGVTDDQPDGTLGPRTP
jgi:hypothetical protein